MDTIVQVAHWIAYGYLVYAFGYASLFKVFQKESMMTNMKNFGFGKVWTLLIGYGEVVGVAGLIVGLWMHEVKNLSTLWLFPFAVGALMVHFAHNDYKYYFTAFFSCIASVVLLLTAPHFHVII